MTSTLESMPKDIQLHALSFCDERTLAAMPRLSHYWRNLTGDDSLWTRLFKLRFQEYMPQMNRCFVAYAKKANPFPLHNLEELNNKIVHFCCNQKWDVKREFTCFFPKQNNLYFVNIQHSFGPHRGTPEGFIGLPDEVSYFQFLGHLKQPPLLKSPDPIGVENIKLITRFYPTDAVFKEERIPYSVSYHCTYPKGAEKKYQFENWVHCHTLDKISGVDVGYGNTLGFFSEINGWKSPFKLFCTSGLNGKPVWVGPIPTHKRFKFAIITPQNDVIWEKGGTADEFRNRLLFSDDENPGEGRLIGELSDCPIEFPKF